MLCYKNYNFVNSDMRELFDDIVDRFSFTQSFLKTRQKVTNHSSRVFKFSEYKTKSNLSADREKMLDLK